MTPSITHQQASKALAEAQAAGTIDPRGGIYYVTAAEAEERDGMTVYMVGYAAADPEEDDTEGDPAGFITGPDGNVICTGPVF